MIFVKMKVANQKLINKLSQMRLNNLFKIIPTIKITKIKIKNKNFHHSI